MKKKLSILCMGLAILLLSNCHRNDKDFFFEEEYPPVENIIITEKGDKFEIPAISGHCIVFFKDEITPSQARNIIERNSGKIIEQMPDFGYYLAKVQVGKENDFIGRMKAESQVEYVFLNTVVVPKSDTYIIDDFTSIDSDLLTTHGNTVKYIFLRYGSVKGSLHTVDLMKTIDAYLKPAVNSAVNIVCKKLLQTASKTSQGVVLFNLSLGIRKLYGNHRLFDDFSNDDQTHYKKAYVYDLKTYSKCFEKMRGRGFSNFIVSKASGNEGMYNIEDIINELDVEERQSLERNMVLVNAYDTKTDTLYSNNVSSKHSLATMVDISPDPWTGTSFAAPKLLGFVDRITAKYSTLSAQDILTAIRNATPCDTKQPMTYEMLEREAAKLAETRKQCKRYTFTLNMTSDYRGEWDLSKGKKQDIVKYHVHDTYGYEYLSGKKMAIEIDNQTNYDLEMLLSVLDTDKEVRSLRYILEKGQTESFYARQSDFFGDSEHLSVRELQVTITTW